MGWSNRDEAVFNQIEEWKKELSYMTGDDVTQTFSRWVESSFDRLPEDVKSGVLARVDSSLFHLHHVLQGTHLHIDARERMLATARSFDGTIDQVHDFSRLTIDQLHFMALQQVGRHRLYSFIQGGVAGTGGVMAFSTDGLAMLLLNLRAVQFIGTAYGRDVQTPYEMTVSLKVFQAATMPLRFQAKAWEELIESIELGGTDYFFSGDDQIADVRWVEEVFKQLAKSATISLFRKKKVGNIPLLSMSIGAFSNYQITRRITDFAERFYQYRYLMEKKQRTNETLMPGQ